MAIVLANVDKIVSSAATGSQVLDLDNLPSGGEQKFVATGAIASGDVVGLKADGTVEVIKETVTQTPQTEDIGNPVVFGSGTVYYCSATFDPHNNKVIIAYSNGGNSSYGTAIVGEVSGNSISFGSPVVFNSAATVYTSAAFDPSTNKVVIAYSNGGNSQYGTAVVGEVSGNSISFGSPVVFESASTYQTSAAFDLSTNKVVIAYKDNANSGFGTAIIGEVSGNSISFGSPVVFESAEIVNISAVFDSNTNKVVIAYTDILNSSYGTAIVGEVSGNSISFGSPVVFNSAGTYDISAAFDASTNKVVIAYRDNGNSYFGTAVVGEVSGNSISFGTPIVFENDHTANISATFDSNINKVVIAYRDRGNSGFGTAIVGEVSGNSISFGSPVVFNSAATVYTSAAFDPSTNKVVIAYSDDGNSSYGTATVYTAPGTSTTRTINASSWLGIANEAIADTQTGAVTLYGGVAKNLTGLTPNTKYYVNYDGTLTDTPNEGKTQGTYGEIGMALSSDKLLITSGNL